VIPELGHFCLILALVLAGGRGSRLKQLTDWRAKPAVPMAPDPTPVVAAAPPPSAAAAAPPAPPRPDHRGWVRFPG
jgi:hypothetical protein